MVCRWFLERLFLMPLTNDHLSSRSSGMFPDLPQSSALIMIGLKRLEATKQMGIWGDNGEESTW